MAILHEIHDAISQSLVDSELRHAVLEATFFKLEIPPIVERVALGLVNFCLCVEQRVKNSGHSVLFPVKIMIFYQPIGSWSVK